MTPHLSTHRIYMEDVDAQGIVYHANYLRYFERARTECLRDMQYDIWNVGKATGLGFVMRRCVLDFKKPASLNDLVTIQTLIGAQKGARLSFFQTLEKEGEVLVSLDSHLACVNQEGLPVRLPTSLKDLLSTHSNKRNFAS